MEPTDAGFETQGCDFWYRVGVDDPNPTVVTPGQPFGQGQYRVGVEVAPGRYLSAGPTDPDGFCYWARLKGFHNVVGDIAANWIGRGAAVVDIGAQDVGFESSGCQQWVKIG